MTMLPSEPPVTSQGDTDTWTAFINEQIGPLTTPPTTSTAEDDWAFENFINTDALVYPTQQPDQSSSAAGQETLPPTSRAMMRRRSSSVNTLHPPYHQENVALSYPSLSYSPMSVSSFEDIAPTSPSPPRENSLFADLDLTIVTPTVDNGNRQFRRRSSSVPPQINGGLKPVILHKTQVADTRPPSVIPLAPVWPDAREHRAQPIKIERWHPRHHPAKVDPAQRHAEMEDKLKNVNFDDVTVAELKDLLRHCGLSTSGRKVELIERLRQQQQKRQQQQQRV